MFGAGFISRGFQAAGFSVSSELGDFDCKFCAFGLQVQRFRHRC